MSSKSRLEFEAKAEGLFACGLSSWKHAAFIALAALSVMLAAAWTGPGSKVGASANAAGAHSQPGPATSWTVTVSFGDGTTATGYVDYDPPGVGRAVTIRVDLSCGHTHTLHGIQASVGVMQGNSVDPGHSNASVRASKYARLDVASLEEVDWQATGGP